MSGFQRKLADPERAAQYTTKGPPAFMPGHAGFGDTEAFSAGFTWRGWMAYA